MWRNSQERFTFKNWEYGLADKAYCSLNEQNLIAPYKGKRVNLTPQQKRINHFINRNRVIVERVIGYIKIFRILKEKFRNRVGLHFKIFNICANIYEIKLNIKEEKIKNKNIKAVELYKKYYDIF
ncbi:hypothetical protein ACTFIR_003612 [Dictyostelium discoideum]